MRTRASLNADWRFHLGDLEGQGGAIDDRGWRRVDVPHDWGIEGPFAQEHPGETGKLPWWGVGWYRKRFAVSARADRRFRLEIDGAMSHAEVWLNGKKVGGWPYGYASFALDLTPFVRAGQNVLAVRLDNPPNSSRWYPGAGIFRNVWLVETSSLAVAYQGTFVTTPEVTPQAAAVKVAVTVENTAAQAAHAIVRSTVHALGAKGGIASAPVEIDVPAGASATATLALSVPEPRLWSLAQPNLYVAVTTIERGGRVVDRHETVFGVRTIRFDADGGFLLNGVRVPIRGVCLHHDLGALGAALNVRALERQLQIMQEMGANAIRTSHNPPAPELLELTDRLGLLVMDELTDTWKAPKKPNGYNTLYDEWFEKDLRALIRRDRNHPSVILWSTGNEVPEQTQPEGAAMSARHTAIAHDEDPTRPVSSGNNKPAATAAYQKTFDVYGQNYHTEHYAKLRQANPGRPLIASETSSAVSTRGAYFFPVTADKLGGRADFQVSSYDLYGPPWAATPDDEFRALDQAPWMAGEFVWTGFDYLGEPTPYNKDATNLLNASDPATQQKLQAELKELGKIRVPSRSSYFGIVDLAGFKKDRFFAYQARWRPELPMAHLLPHWTWPERVGQVTPVHVYTSGDEAELFLDGRSLGRKKKASLTYRLRWDDVVYAPGELKVITYKDGRPWATDVQRTAGVPAAIVLQADRARIAADGRDLAFVTASIVDKDGTLVPRAQTRIRFTVTGPGAIAATDNGDPTSHEPFGTSERAAFNGLALAIVRGKAGAPGRVTVTAEGEGEGKGLRAAQVKLETAR